MSFDIVEIDGVGIAADRLKVETQGSVVTPDPTAIVRSRLQNGGSGDLLVDGSGTPILFTLAAHATKTTKISSIRFVLTADKIEYNGDRFGEEPALTNGVKLAVFLTGVETQLALITVNEELLELQGRIWDNSAGKKDVLVTDLILGGAIELAPASTDEVRVYVQDDLTAGSFSWFTAVVLGVLE